MKENLHQQFIHHDIFRRIKEQTESIKSGVWTMVQESKYEGLDRDITRAMLHAKSVCLLKHKHITRWSPAIGRATSTIRYWDLPTKQGGIQDRSDNILDYYLRNFDVEADFDISLHLRDCIHQIHNSRAKLKAVITNATELRSKFEVDLAIAVVEHKRP
jgi:hypothetical protein